MSTLNSHGLIMGLKLPICLYLCRMKSYCLISIVSIQYVKLNRCLYEVCVSILCYPQRTSQKMVLP